MGTPAYRVLGHNGGRLLGPTVTGLYRRTLFDAQGASCNPCVCENCPQWPGDPQVYEDTFDGPTFEIGWDPDNAEINAGIVDMLSSSGPTSRVTRTKNLQGVSTNTGWQTWTEAELVDPRPLLTGSSGGIYRLQQTQFVLNPNMFEVMLDYDARQGETQQFTFRYRHSINPGQTPVEFTMPFAQSPQPGDVLRVETEQVTGDPLRFDVRWYINGDLKHTEPMTINLYVGYEPCQARGWFFSFNPDDQLPPDVTFAQWDNWKWGISRT